MTGFIKNLFGSKGNSQPKAPKPEEKGGAYFLSADEAKTLGDIEYMRTPKKVKHTFPKGKVEGEYEVEISAMGKSDASKPQSTVSDAAFASMMPASNEPSEPSPTLPNGDRRKSDTSLDMFRNMARDIKKK
jgi:hypothetical protein